MSDSKPHPPKFSISPYPDEVEQERMHIYIAKSDTDFIRCLRPRPGTFTAVGTHLWAAFCVRCREMGITDFTQTSQFEHLIQNVVVISKEEYARLQCQSGDPVAKTGATASPESSGSSHATGDSTGSERRTPLRPVPNADGHNAGGSSPRVRQPSSNRSKKRTDV